MVKESRTRLECPWCGPFYKRMSDTHGICPKCNLTPAEVAYAERIIADSTAVWREENRAFQAQRSKGGS
jgi:ribosomal protein L37AE/L43A